MTAYFVDALECEECGGGWNYVAARAVLVSGCNFFFEQEVCGEGESGVDINSKHTFIAHSQNITMTNLDMNATPNLQYKTVNTDGTDTWNSKDIVISNWTVTSPLAGLVADKVARRIESQSKPTAATSM